MSLPSMDVLKERKKARNLALKQKNLCGGALNVYRVGYIENTDSSIKANAMQMFAIHRRLKKAKVIGKGLEADGKAYALVGDALGINYKTALQNYREYSNTPRRVKEAKLYLDLNKNHRLVRNKILDVTAGTDWTYTVTLDQPFNLLRGFSNNIEGNKMWTYSDIVNMRKQPIGRTMKKFIETAREDLRKPSLKPESTAKDNYVGIEIECASSKDTDDMIEHIALTRPSLSKYVRVGSDGSIRTEEKFPYAIEFRLMVKEQDKDRIIKEFIEVTKGLLKVNNSCGLHVHIDMRNRNYGRSFEQLYVAMPILMSMVPSSRRSNTYCKENTNKKGWSSGRSDRYEVLNTTSFRKYKTLEVRVHSATTSAYKIINWIDLLLCVVDKKFEVQLTSDGKPDKVTAAPDRQIRSLIRFFDRFSVPANLRNYVVRRIAKFGKTESLIVPKELTAAVPVNATANEEESMQEESA